MQKTLRQILLVAIKEASGIFDDINRRQKCKKNTERKSNLRFQVISLSKLVVSMK